MTDKSLPEVAQVYAMQRGQQSLIAYVTERIDQPHYQPSQAHELIAALPCQTIVATQWDNLQERALERAGKAYHKVVRDIDLSFRAERRVLLVKLHGSIEQKDSLVITGDAYYQLSERLPLTFKLLQSYLATQTVLFIGFQLDDNHFKQLFLEVERGLQGLMRRAYAAQASLSADATTYWQQHHVAIVAADSAEFLAVLQSSLASMPSSSTTTQASVAVTPSPPLHQLDAKLDALLSEQRGLRDDLSHLRQALLGRYTDSERAIVAAIAEQLNQAQMDTVQAVMVALDRQQISKAETQQLLEATRTLIAMLSKQQRIAPQQREIAEALETPELETTHKLRLTVPLIPLLLDYEGELELSSEINLRAVWQQLVAKIKK
jgi:hypothetical protein